MRQQKVALRRLQCASLQSVEQWMAKERINWRISWESPINLKSWKRIMCPGQSTDANSLESAWAVEKVTSNSTQMVALVASARFVAYCFGMPA